VRDAGDGVFLGFASMFRLDLPAREGEIGYAVWPSARGRGVARRALGLLTRWGFDELGLERLELRISVANAASERVAERAGYRREGVLRSVHFKEGRRIDLGVWSLLRSDEPNQ
jgi:RimJ/RimL family protein N-acetyltransferase